MEQGLATQTSAELNKKLKAAISTIDKKLKKILGKNGGTLLTNGSFKYNENDSNTINIFTGADLNYLAKGLAKMRRVKKETEETYASLGIETYPIITWYGHPVDNWINDFEVRLVTVANATVITQLQQSKTELSTFMSQEDRLRDTLTKVSTLLK